LYLLAKNGFFIISLIITVAVNVTVVVLLLVHFFKWKVEYERNLPDGELFIKNIVREEWFNHECDEEFGTFKNSIYKVQGELYEHNMINDHPFESTTSKLFAVEVRSREENVEDSS
jgi:ABC-type transport system involved in Fe-S cluster assembly fused permease/ATPase subunit